MEGPQLPKEKILSITRNHLCKGKQSLGENERASELPTFQLCTGHRGKMLLERLPGVRRPGYEATGSPTLA